MSSSGNRLPVYGPGHELLYFVPLSRVERLIAEGLVRPVGTKHRIRGLVAMCRADELLRAARPPVGQRFSHNHESDDNPRGVWTHNLRRCLSYRR